MQNVFASRPIHARLPAFPTATPVGRRVSRTAGARAALGRFVRRTKLVAAATAAVATGSGAYASIVIDESIAWSSCTFAPLCGTDNSNTPVQLTVKALLPDGFNLAFSTSSVSIASSQFESISYTWTVGGVDRTALLYPLAPTLQLTKTAAVFGQRPLADVLGISFLITDPRESAGFIDPNYFFHVTSNSAAFVTGGLVSQQLTVSNVTPTIPEPGSALLSGGGLLLLGAWKRRRQVATRS